MGEYIAGDIEKAEMKAILEKGMRSRWDDDSGLFVRYPGSDEMLNRDQCMFLIPLLHEVGLSDIALHLEKWHIKFKLPHWTDFWHNQDTWWGARFEVLDALADRISKTETSIVKNVGRLCWNEFKGGDHNKCAWKHLKKAYDPIRVMEIFGSRGPNTSEDDYPSLPTTPSINTWPPIYIPWRVVVPRYAR